jgi:hypothetical protein
MFVSRMKNEIVLHSERRDPNVIRGNRCSLLSKLPREVGVVVGRLVVGKEDFNASLQKELSQNQLVLGPTASAASFRLLPLARARSRNAASSDAGMPRMTYRMQQ